MTTIDVPQPDSRSVIRTTAATTAFVVGWYALPDYVRSRPARALLKTAGLTAFAVLGIREARKGDSWQDAVDAVRGLGTPSTGPGQTPDHGADLDPGAHLDHAANPDHLDHPAASDQLPPTDRSAQAAALAGAGLVVVGSSVLTVVVEKRVFRRNEARAARGTRLPHTRSALLFGVLTALVAVPDVLHSRAAESAAS